MPARILFLGASDDDYAVLSKYVRPGPNTEIKFCNISAVYPAEHEKAGLPMAVEQLAGYRADAVIYSEHIGDSGERELIFANVLRAD